MWEVTLESSRDLALLGRQLSKPDVISQLEREEVSLITKEFPGCVSPDWETTLETKESTAEPTLLKIYPMGNNGKGRSLAFFLRGNLGT